MGNLEAEMKKIIITIMMMYVTGIIISEEYNLEKIKEFPQGNLQEGFFYRKIVDEDDFSKNYICFDENGVFYNYQDDSHRMMKFDNKLNLQEENILELSRNPFIVSVKNGKYIFDGYYGGFKVFDKEKLIIRISMSKMVPNGNTGDGRFYYNDEYDLLLFTDKSSNIHSIIHPGLDEEENKKNYRTPEETRELFSENSEYGKKGIVIDGKKLYIYGKPYYWENAFINKYQYLLGSRNFYVTNDETDVDVLVLPVAFNSEHFESAAVHPSGDIYILRMNWQTNTHNLYYVENTWDSQWREQWYKEHPEAARP